MRHPLSSTDISIFHLKLVFFHIGTQNQNLHFQTQFVILLAIIEFLKIVLISLITIWMMSSKFATPVLYKIIVF